MHGIDGSGLILVERVAYVLHTYKVSFVHLLGRHQQTVPCPAVGYLYQARDAALLCQYFSINTPQHACILRRMETSLAFARPVECQYGYYQFDEAV